LHIVQHEKTNDAATRIPCAEWHGTHPGEYASDGKGAGQAARSIGSMARLIFLRGLATYRQQPAPQTSHSLVFPRNADYD